MNEHEIKKLIKLIKRWDGGKGNYTFGDLIDLQDLVSQFSNAVDESWRNDEFE